MPGMDTGDAKTAESDSPTDEAPLASGMEINLGDFTRTQGLMKSVRLMLNNQLVVAVEDIAGGVSDAGRKFKIGDIEQANLDIARLYSAFSQRINQWESQARNLEQQMKMQAAKNPKAISIDKMNRMKAEQTAVRTRIRTAEVQFRRLHQGLDQAYTNLQSQPIPAASEPPTALPADFLTRFQAAPIADRPAHSPGAAQQRCPHSRLGNRPNQRAEARRIREARANRRLASQDLAAAKTWSRSDAPS
jgi:hypothetical protein